MVIITKNIKILSLLEPPNLNLESSQI